VAGIWLKKWRAARNAIRQGMPEQRGFGNVHRAQGVSRQQLEHFGEQRFPALLCGTQDGETGEGVELLEFVRGHHPKRQRQRCSRRHNHESRHKGFDFALELRSVSRDCRAFVFLNGVVFRNGLVLRGGVVSRQKVRIGFA
jgi:hypothetical protein